MRAKVTIYIVHIKCRTDGRNYPKMAIQVTLIRQEPEKVIIDNEENNEVVMEVRKSQEAYLVTGNLKHFPTKSYVVTPREMIEIINEG